MIAALLMLAPAPQTAVDAERAFAARARLVGQWRAFAEYADPAAVMFVPQPVPARTWLARQAEAPRGLEWEAAASFVACDGDTAVNTGPWWRGAAHGAFTTVWQRDPAAGWRWRYDGAGTPAGGHARGAAPRVETASCARAPVSNTPFVPTGATRGGGSSRDRSLLWSWQVDADGTRHFTARLWTGERYRTVIADTVPASPHPR